MHGGNARLCFGYYRRRKQFARKMEESLLAANRYVYASHRQRIFTENDSGTLRSHRKANAVVLQDYCRFGENGEYTIEPVAEFRYRKGAFRCNKHEDFAELLAEQGRTVRFHFRGLTDKVTYDDTRVLLTDGAEKTLDPYFRKQSLYAAISETALSRYSGNVGSKRRQRTMRRAGTLARQQQREFD